MNILILNGSMRPNGNTAAMAEVFVDGAKENGRNLPVCKKLQTVLPSGENGMNL